MRTAATKTANRATGEGAGGEMERMAGDSSESPGKRRQVQAGRVSWCYLHCAKPGAGQSRERHFFPAHPAGEEDLSPATMACRTITLPADESPPAGCSPLADSDPAGGCCPLADSDPAGRCCPRRRANSRPRQICGASALAPARSALNGEARRLPSTASPQRSKNYAAWPGQAVAPMTGETEMRELHQRGKRCCGRISTSAFVKDLVLLSGAVRANPARSARGWSVNPLASRENDRADPARLE